MKSLSFLLVMLGMVFPVSAADVQKGEAKSAACRACHGGNGVSVSEDIPNLAGQKAKYLATQLEAFRDGTRTNPLMNAMAGQLEDDDIENLAAFFSSLPGATGSAVSELPDAINQTRVSFPAQYAEEFTRYTTIDFPERKQVRHYFANDAALQAAGKGEPLPYGSVLLVEIYKTKLDTGGEPVEGSDGFFEADELVAFTAMEMGKGWGDDIPALLRNEDWNYAVFKADGTLRTGVNQATCLACHKPLVNESYVFSMESLAAKARAQQ